MRSLEELYGKGTGIVIPITYGKREGNWESSGKFFLRRASESEQVFARILDEFFRCFDLPGISVLSEQTVQIFKTS